MPLTAQKPNTYLPLKHTRKCTPFPYNTVIPYYLFCSSKRNFVVLKAYPSRASQLSRVERLLDEQPFEDFDDDADEYWDYSKVDIDDDENVYLNYVDDKRKKGKRSSASLAATFDLESTPSSLTYTGKKDDDVVEEQPIDRQEQIEKRFKKRKPKIQYLNSYTRRFSGIVTEAHLKATFRKSVGKKIGEVKLLRTNLTRISKAVLKVGSTLGYKVIPAQEMIGQEEESERKLQKQSEGDKVDKEVEVSGSGQGLDEQLEDKTQQPDKGDQGQESVKVYKTLDELDDDDDKNVENEDLFVVDHSRSSNNIKRTKSQSQNEKEVHILQFLITEEFTKRIRRWSFGEVSEDAADKVPWVKESQIPQLVGPIAITEKLTALYMKECREGRCPPFICPACRMPFANTKALLSHIGAKHGLLCALCGKQFRLIEDFLRHLQVMELEYGGRLYEAVLAEFMVSKTLAKYGSEKMQNPNGPFSSQVMVPNLRGQIKSKLMIKAKSNRLLNRTTPDEALDNLIERISSPRAEYLLLPRKKSYTKKQRRLNAKDTEGSRILNLVGDESRLACDFDSVVEDWAEIPDDLKFGRNPRLFEITKKCVLLARRSALRGEVKIYKCPACGKNFQTVAAWIDHARNIHRFACTFCEETLKRYFYLLVHMSGCRPEMVPHVAKIYREMLAMDETQYRMIIHPRKEKKTYKSRNRPYKMHREYIDKLREEGVIQPKKHWRDLAPYDDETAWD